MQKLENILILFTKYPVPGFSKTRLIPELGSQQAAALQEKMTSTIVQTTVDLQKSTPHLLEIHYTGGTLTQMQQWLGISQNFKKQADSSLGDRLVQAVLPHLQHHKSIIIIGADCPGITVKILHESMKSLVENELVIGPCYDGGYYLIGLGGKLSTESVHTLFKDISWGSRHVYSQTMERITSLNLQCHTLSKLHDIDTPDDLRHINYYPDAQ